MTLMFNLFFHLSYSPRALIPIVPHPSLKICCFFLLAIATSAGEDTADFEMVKNEDSLKKIVANHSFNTLKLTDHDGSILMCEGDQLLRKIDDKIVKLTPISQESTGQIHDLESDPGGVVYVIADNGIYISSPNSERLIQLKLKNGSPKGRPRSAHFDVRRRLWLATDEEFGVVDTRFFTGRVFTENDGLMPSLPIGIMADKDNSLLFFTEKATYRYRLDTGHAPTISVATVNGQPYHSAKPIRIQYPGNLNLTLTGSGRGGVTFRVVPHERKRYRVKSVEGDTVSLGDFDPGIFDIAIVAVDRDLNESQPLFIKVHVQWPFYFHPRFLVGVGVSLAVLVFIVALVAAWKIGKHPKRYQLALVSALLLMWIGIQILAAIVPHARTWPIVGWSMYTSSRQEGSLVGPTVIEGITEDGHTFPIDAWQTYKIYPSQLIHPLVNYGRDAASSFLKSYNDQVGEKTLIGVQVRNKYRYALTNEGPVRVPPRVYMRFTKEGT